MSGNFAQELYQAMAVLKECPRELWVVYALILLDGFAYFSLSYSLVLYLSEEFGQDDVRAGWTYGIYGMLISVYGLTLGFVIDMFGVRLSIIGSNVCLLIGRMWLTITKSEGAALAMLYIMIPLGEALLQPAMTTGLRRYTTDETRSMAFSLFYVFMNVGALLAAPLVDLTRYLAEDGVTVPLIGELSAYRTIIFAGALATLLALALSFLMKEINVSKSGEVEDHTPLGGSPVQIMKEVASTSRFWRFMLLILLLIGVGMIFRHLDATFPKYMVREHGATVPYGSIISINPFLIIFLVPALTPITKNRAQYDVMLLGAFLTAVSVLWMVVGPYIWCAVMFVVTMSFGEALWSPRLFEYTAMVAPKGREGTYMALSNAPNFVAKVFVGGLSGYLLEEHCPSEKNCSGGMLWFIVFLLTFSSPLLMYLCKGTIRKCEVTGDEDAVSDEHESDSENDTQALLGGIPTRTQTFVA